NASGNFAITISPGVTLPPGHYWVSVQVNMDYGAPTAGQWFWLDRATTSNISATWQNPGGGFGSCSTWGHRGTDCASDPTEPDQVFRLVGTSTGPTPTEASTPTVTP